MKRKRNWKQQCEVYQKLIEERKEREGRIPITVYLSSDTVEEINRELGTEERSKLLGEFFEKAWKERR